MNNAPPPSILSKILSTKKEEIAQAKKTENLNELKEIALSSPPARSFSGQIKNPGKISLIAEIKQKSPSKGLIRPDMNIKEIASTYTQAGASAISVLAEKNFFGGKPEYVNIARQHTELPVLYKDFIIDPCQIYRARACGADAILLIIKILTEPEIKEFIEITQELGMEVLAETRSISEINTAINAGAKNIGINNRDLENFETDINTTLSLSEKISTPDITLISESGIHTRAHMEKLLKYKVHAALVGESLMRSPNLYRAVRELLAFQDNREAG